MEHGLALGQATQRLETPDPVLVLREPEAGHPQDRVPLLPEKEAKVAEPEVETPSQSVKTPTHNSYWDLL